MVSEAFAAVQRNYRALILYLVATIGITSITLAIDTLIIDPRRDTLDVVYLRTFDFSADIVTAVVFALAQAIVFSKMGAEIDRPLWKISGVSESIRKFFSLWFILMLVNIALARFTERADESGYPAVAYVLSSCWLVWLVIVVPLGSAIMFYGRPGLKEIRMAQETFARQFPRTLVVFLMALVIIVLFQALLSYDFPKWTRPFLGMIDGYGDCLLFSCTWILCMLHRDDDGDDIDFDF